MRRQLLFAAAAVCVAAATFGDPPSPIHGPVPEDPSNHNDWGRYEIGTGKTGPYLSLREDAEMRAVCAPEGCIYIQKKEWARILKYLRACGGIDS